MKGRADGYDAAANRLEEIKTHRGRLERQPGNHRHLHWAQLRLYGWLVCAARGLSERTGRKERPIDGALVHLRCKKMELA